MRLIQSVLLLSLIFIISNSIYAAANPSIDLDQEADAWSKIIIVVANVPATNINGNTFEIMVDHVIFGSWIVENKKIKVQYDQLDSYYQLDKGEYILLLHWSINSINFGNGSIILGPIRDFIKIKSINDPLIDQVQIISDTASIGIPLIKKIRLDELFKQRRNQSLVVQYVLNAQKNIADSIIFDLVSTATQVVYSAKRKQYDVDTLLLADKMLMYAAPTLGGPVWPKSNERKELLTNLQQQLSQTDPRRSYIVHELNTLANDCK